MSTAIFDRVSSLVEEIGREKTAAAKAAMDDPGGQDGPSTHPSATKDDNELPQPAPEGEQSADNESAVKEQTPNVPDNDPELTPEAAPTQDEVQLGQGVDKAKATGEDPGVEEDYKGTKDDPSEAGGKDMGGTSHPASGDIGEKYSSFTRESVAALSDDELFKAAADIGGELAADLANGFYARGNTATAKNAASNGYATAAASQGGELDESDVFASAIIGETVKSAQHQAGLVADYVNRLQHDLSKNANEAELLADPTSGAAEGEAYGSDPRAGGGDLPPEILAQLAAMEGGGGGMPPGGGGMPPEGGEEGLPAEAGFGEEELLSSMADGGGPGEGLGGPEDGLAGGPADTLDAMPEEDAVQELAMALAELGVDPAELAAAASGASADVAAPKIASAVDSYKRSGRFKFTEAKQGTAQRRVRDYMKGYVSELVSRN